MAFEQTSWSGALRRFLFQTWLGSGPPPPCLAPLAPVFANESRKLLVVFATNRGRGFCNGVPKGVPEDVGAITCYKF